MFVMNCELKNKSINIKTYHQANQCRLNVTRHATSGDVRVSVSYFGGHRVRNRFLPTLSFFFFLSLSDTGEIRVFQLVCECCDICYYAFQRVVFGDLFAGLENEFNITGLESTGFIISITVALSDTKLSFKHPNDTLKFNEILSPANI